MKSFLYNLLKLLNDLGSIFKGTTGKRVGRRSAGKATGKIFKDLFK